ncbi:hypothetical protein ACQUQU_08740 [Thalassolituus sp. LLYu03]|uniref:hypothetical protein n=1 Tax=Thalassolituus sp. LLYu03 TaxID=3421656 RepID=UPI003D2B41E1
MMLKDSSSDWIIPCVLLIPHAILLSSILIILSDNTASTFQVVKDLFEVAAYAATIAAVLFGFATYQSWQHSISTNRSLESIDTAMEITKKLITLTAKSRNEARLIRKKIGNENSISKIKETDLEKISELGEHLSSELTSLKIQLKRPLINSKIEDESKEILEK